MLSKRSQNERGAIMTIANLRRQLEKENQKPVFIMGYYLDEGKTRWLFVEKDIIEKIYNTGFIKAGDETADEFVENLDTVTGDFHYQIFLIDTYEGFDVHFYYITDDLLELANHSALLEVTR